MKQGLEKVRDNPSLRGRTFVFKDRVQAGALLAQQLKQYLVKPLLILAIPRGGIPVAFAISEEMSAAFDLIISRKIPLSYTLEAGYGAVTWNDIVVLNTELTTQLQLSEKEIQEGILSTKQQVEKQSIQYRGQTSLPNPKDKTVILVDDGIASGYSMLAAIKFVQQHTPRKIFVAIPTAPSRSLRTISPFIDKIECLNIRDTQYFAVADAYLNWQDLPEKTALSYLKDARYFLKEQTG
jgi:predicted phosphoribosyltransferase